MRSRPGLFQPQFVYCRNFSEFSADTRSLPPTIHPSNIQYIRSSQKNAEKIYFS